jgi:hypothetical protein
MPRGDTVEHVIEWEQLLALPDGARCSVCADIAGARTRRPVCVLSFGGNIQHHALPFLACDECYIIGQDHLGTAAD